MKYSIISTKNGEHLGSAETVETARSIGISYANWNIACSVVDSETGEVMADFTAYKDWKIKTEPELDPIDHDGDPGSEISEEAPVSETFCDPNFQLRLGFNGGRPVTFKELKAAVGPGWSDIPCSTSNGSCKPWLGRCSNPIEREVWWVAVLR
jgi:hypothetical protein